MRVIRLNIGCGRDYRPGWWNCDFSPSVKSDAVLDIRKDRLPFDDGAVESVYISGVLEQILLSEELVHAMNECWRVLKPGGAMTVIVPNAMYAIAHQDPFDVRKFIPETFNYFLAGHQKHRDYGGESYGFKPWSGIAIEENARHILTVTMTK